MRYFILLVMLAASSLFAADKVQSTDAAAIEQTNAELSKIREEIIQAKEMANSAREDANAALEEFAEVKAQKEVELAELAAKEELLKKNESMTISVVGQGVAPMNTISPAQAYALAKRAAIADAYRAIAEKVKGVRIDGQDTIKNMMVQRSTVRTFVQAMVKNADVVETTFKEGLCEVEMEIVISYSDFAQ